MQLIIAELFLLQGAWDMKEIRTRESLNSIYILVNKDHANKSRINWRKWNSELKRSQKHQCQIEFSDLHWIYYILYIGMWCGTVVAKIAFIS